jgi:hypothetical protein
MTLPGIPGVPAAVPGIPLPFGLTLPIDWTLLTNWKLPMELPIPEGLPLPVPPEHAYAKGMLIAWAQLNGGPTLGYGKNAAEFSPVWSSRDSIELRGFRTWWNSSGYTPQASANTGQGTDVTYPTPADIDALTAWGKKTAVNPPNLPPAAVPPGVPPAAVTCAGNCEKQHGFGSSKPDPVAFATCIAACGGQLPGGGSAPGGGAGGAVAVTSCPEGYVLSAGICQPLPAAQKKEEEKKGGGGMDSTTGLLIAGAVALVGIGLFAATVGAGAGAAVAGGGRGDNPDRRHLRRDKIWYIVAGQGRGSYSKPFSTRYEAEAHRNSLAGPWQGEGVILEVPGADMRDARERSSAVHQGYLDR